MGVARCSAEWPTDGGLPEGSRAEPRGLRAWVEKYGVSRIWLVPSYLRVLVEHIERRGTPFARPGLWVASGEALPTELARRFKAALRCRHDSEFPKSLAICATGAWPLRATATTSRQNSSGNG